MPGPKPLQVYVKVKQEGAPNWQLKGLKKVYLNPGEVKNSINRIKGYSLWTI